MNKMTRIRYSYDGAVYTSKPMLAGNDVVTVVIDAAKTKTFTILDSKDNVVLTGTGKEFHSLKANAKEALVSLGVNFNAELRDSKKKRLAAATPAETSVSEYTLEQHKEHDEVARTNQESADSESYTENSIPLAAS
jgi:uncharacterized protein YpiB (UPF0302 family)